MTDVAHRLKSLDSFSPLSETTLRELASHFEIIYVKNRDVLFRENTPINDLYVVLYGSFKIQNRTPDSKPVILNFLGRGEFLGIVMAGLASPKYPATAIAIEDAAILRFSKEFFFKVLIQIESIRTTVNRQLGERFLEFQHDRCIEHMLTHQRVADLLIRLLERQGQQKGYQLLIPLTRKDIAQRIGTKPETVIRILSVWSKKNWIDTIHRHIAIKNSQKLKEVRDERTCEHAQEATSDDLGDA